MRPQRVVRVLRQWQAGGDPRTREREIALRVRRDRPDAMSPRVDGDWRDPIGGDRRQVAGVVLAVSDVEQAFAELTAIEAVPARVDDGVESAGNARASYDGTRVSRGAEGLATGQLGHARGHGGEKRRRGETVRGIVACGREDVGKRQPSESLMQGEPAVDATGHGSCA